MNLILHNTSRYEDKAVRWLARFAFQSVRAKAKRQGWIENFNNRPFVIRFTNTVWAYQGTYGGSVRAWWLRGYKVKHCPALLRMDGQAWVRDVIVRIGKPERYPVKDATYGKFKNMPPASYADWQEGAVAVIAHELAHCQASGKREGEVFCEYTAHEALEQFRAVRAEFEQAMISKPAGDDAGADTNTTSQEPELVNT